MVDVVLDRVAWGGDAIGNLSDGRVIFVDSGFPGDQVRVRLTEDKKRFAKGSVVETTKAGAPTVSACPTSATCGGCRFQGMEYSHELELKASALDGMLRRVAKDVAWPELTVVPSSSPSGYRERVRLRVDVEGQTGYLGRGSHEFVPAIECWVLHPALEAARALAGRICKGLPRVHQIRLEWDDVRKVVVLEIPAEPETWRRIEDEVRARATGESLDIVFGDSKTATLAIAIRHQGRWTSVVGDAHVHRQFGEVVVVQRSGNFSQAHRVLNVGLRSRVAHWIREGFSTNKRPKVIDLYGGAGNLSFAAADLNMDVVCVDHASEALEAGRQSDTNRRIRDWIGLDLHAGPFEIIAPVLGAADALILDPPRGGISPEFVESLSQTSAKRAVHVSCDPPAFARDMSRLSAFGWRVERMEAWDMFPRTPHLELVALMVRES